jgi:hypothetical protein
MQKELLKRKPKKSHGKDVRKIEKFALSFQP